MRRAPSFMSPCGPPFALLFNHHKLNTKCREGVREGRAYGPQRRAPCLSLRCEALDQQRAGRPGLQAENPPQTCRENFAVELSLKAAGNQPTPQGRRKCPAHPPSWFFSLSFLCGLDTCLALFLGPRWGLSGLGGIRCLMKISLVLSL